jgi:multisubunit Na+/H+ antiporter MnhG subunit
MNHDIPDPLRMNDRRQLFPGGGMRTSNICKSVSSEQTKGFGMAICLAFLVGAYFTNERWTFQVSILLLLVTIIRPCVYKPFASVWFGLSELIGNLASKLILALLFILLVTPFGVVRRALGIDALNLRKWKKDDSSVFRVRDHVYASEDMDKPY